MIIIPGELISLISFPGVIFHEISHRLLCDFNHVDVYEIHYYKLLSDTAGHVIHAPTKNVCKMFFIATAPLIINSLICILFTLPTAAVYSLDHENIIYTSNLSAVLYSLLGWIGFSAGFHAIPSNIDVEDLVTMAEYKVSKFFLYIFTTIIKFLNLNYIGFLFRIFYVIFLSRILTSYLFN